MAKDHPESGDKPATERRGRVDEQKDREDVLFESDREALKRARDEQKVSVEGDEGAGDYANLHFGEQKLDDPARAASVESDGEFDRTSHNRSALSESATSSNLKSFEIGGRPALADFDIQGLGFKLSGAEETTEGKAFFPTTPEGATEDGSLIDLGAFRQSFVEDTRPLVGGGALHVKSSENDAAAGGEAPITDDAGSSTDGDGDQDSPIPDPHDDGEAAAQNSAPTDIAITGLQALENQSGAFIGRLSAVDSDVDDTIDFSIIDDQSGLFEISGDELRLRDGLSFDFEQQQDYQISIRATDSVGNEFEKLVTVNVTDVNEAPHGIELSNLSVDENAAGGVVGALSASDPDLSDTLTYAVSDDRFEVVDGNLKLKDGVALDAEDVAAIDLTVTATDADGLSTAETFSISVGDVNEAPTLGVVTGAGLQASYYVIGHALSDLDDVDFDAVPDAMGVVDSLNYMTGQQAFWDGAPGDYFAAKYEGQLIVNESGSYTINMASDDGSMLFVDGVAVIDNDGLHGTQTRSVSLNLEAGAHDIEVRYFENGGSQTLQLAWAGPDTGGVMEVIRGGSFEHGASLDNLTVGDDEAGAVIAQLSVTDPDAGDHHSFSVDDDRFEVVELDSGVFLKLKDGVSVSFESEPTLEVNVTVTDFAGASSSLAFPISVSDTNTAPAINLIGGEGLQASYYNIGHSLSNLDQVDFNAPPDAEGVVQSLDYMGGQEAFWEGAPGDYFAAKYEGQLLIVDGGSYTFSMASDDGSMLFIDGVAVLDNDGLHGTRTRTVTVDLESGAHDIEVRYFENGGSQTLQLAWAGPDTGGATEVIGGSSYRLPGFTDGDILGVSENAAGDTAARLSIVDNEGDAIEITVSDDRFEIVQDEAGYRLKLKDGVAVDYEAESEISVAVTATDAFGESTTETFLVPVHNVSEAPTGLDLTPINQAGALLLNTDGGTDDAAIASNLEGFPTEALTIEVRFSSDQQNVGSGTPLFSYAASNGSDNEVLVWLEGASGNLNIFLAGQKINTGVPNASLLDGEEHQLSFSWDQSTNELKVYVDGAPAFETSVNIRDLKAGGTLVFGQEQDSAGGGFDAGQVFAGEIAEVRIFDYARNAFEISDNAGAPISAPDTEPGLVNNWQMSAGNGGTIKDLAGADNLNIRNGAQVEQSLSFDHPAVYENSPGAVVGVLSATDADTGAAVTNFAIVSDVSGAFEIVDGQLKLRDGVALDREAQDAHEIVVEAIGVGGVSTQHVFTISVENVDESPLDFALAPSTGQNALVLNANDDDDSAIASNLEGFPTDALTVEVRFSSDQSDVGNGTPLFSYAASNGSDNEVLIWLEGASGNLHVFLAGQKINTGVSNASLLDGAEHQVSISWDQSSDQLKVYIDGESAFETSVNIRDLKSGGTLVLGQEQDSAGGGFNAGQIFEGEIAEVRIFDYARTDAEIADNAGAPITAPNTEPGLVNNWRMNAEASGLVEDLAGSNDLQLRNGASIEPSEFGNQPVVAESDAGAIVGSLTATDPETGAAVTTFQLINDDSGLFEIVGNQLKLKDGTAADYETQQAHEITVRAVSNSGEFTDLSVTIQVSDQVELNVITGNEGNDWLRGTAGNDALYGMDGNDRLFGNAGADELYGGAGNDVIYADAADTVIDGGEGNDRVIVQGDDDFSIDMAASNVERVDGGAGNDAIDASGATDGVRQLGNGGDDVLTGGSGNDTQRGGDGNDVIFGGDGNDNIQGNAGADELYGGAGNDVIYADAADTVIDGGEGNDRVIVQGDDDFSIDMAASNVERVDGGAGNDAIDASGATDGVRQLGNGGDDVLTGGSGNDTQRGGDGNDVIFGGDGNDNIQGNAGDDRMIGGSGNDRIVGGAGDDTVVFSGNRSDYTVRQINDTTFRVTDNRDGSPDGVDTVTSVEHFEFADQTIDVENILNAPPTDIVLTPASTVRSVAAQVGNSEISTSNGGGNGVAVVNMTGAVGGEVITLAFTSIDNSFEVHINGESITGQTMQLQSNVYRPDSQAFLQFEDGSAISTPWVGNSDGTPRIVMQISEGGVSIFANRTPGSGNYEAMEIVNGEFTAPELIAGDNSVTIVNPDDDGPDGLQVSVLAQFDEIISGPVEGEDGVVVGTLNAVDADAETGAEFTIADDPSGLFEIAGNEIKVKDGSSLDSAEQPAHEVTVQATDESGAIYQETLSINVQSAKSAPSQFMFGGADNDVLAGGEGDDKIYGSAGDDTLTGAGGDDFLAGGDGSDLFIYETGDGSDQIYGGAGGGWVDVIQLNSGGTTLGEFGVDWTVELTVGSIESVEDGSIIFSDDASGHISLSDGSTINFADIEQLTY